MFANCLLTFSMHLHFMVFHSHWLQAGRRVGTAVVVATTAADLRFQFSGNSG